MIRESCSVSGPHFAHKPWSRRWTSLATCAREARIQNSSAHSSEHQPIVRRSSGERHHRQSLVPASSSTAGNAALGRKRTKRFACRMAATSKCGALLTATYQYEARRTFLSLLDSMTSPPSSGVSSMRCNIPGDKPAVRVEEVEPSERFESPGAGHSGAA